MDRCRRPFRWPAGVSKSHLPNLGLRWWAKPARRDVMRVRDLVLHAVAEALSKEGVDLHFPTQAVLFHEQTEPGDRDRSKQREGWPLAA